MSLQPYDQTNIEDQEYDINNSQEKFSYHDPPESFWLSKDSERDWFDQNAAMQRKSSMKFAFSGKANNKNSKILSHNNQNPSLFSIPKTRKSISGEGNTGRVNDKAVKSKSKSKSKSRFTRSRSEPAGRKTLKQVLVSEPGSPKVSCTGRVRRSKSKKESRTIRTGFWKKVRAALKIRSGEKGGASAQTAESDRFGSGSGSGGLRRSTTRRWSE